MKNPKPWFRASKNAWYVEHHSKQVRLGDHPEGAAPPKKSKAGWNTPPSILDAFYKLMATDPSTLPESENITTAIVCDLFLSHSNNHHCPKTYANYRMFLQSFCTRYGSLLANGMKPFHVSQWMDSHKAWNGARRHAVIAVRRAFSWASQQGILAQNPLHSLRAERVKRRTRILTDGELTEILGTIRDLQFREFVQAMIETGCRPSEVSRVTADNVDFALGVWIFHQHKTGKKTQKPRVVYLTPAMVELSRKLIARHPDGPLFRNPRRNAAFTASNIQSRFRRLAKMLPHLKSFVCYNIRHTFATKALVNGVGVAQVAELLGHSSTDMVSQTYGHLAEQIEHMRDAARKAVNG